MKTKVIQLLIKNKKGKKKKLYRVRATGLDSLLLLELPTASQTYTP
jgi:hypothetical protein